MSHIFISYSHKESDYAHGLAKTLYDDGFDVWIDERFDDGFFDTSPIGGYPDGASVYNVQDMVGNVYEWVADWYEQYPQDHQITPIGPSFGVDKIIRGGSWGDDPAHIRSAIRSPITPENRMNFIGFRCAR